MDSPTETLCFTDHLEATACEGSGLSKGQRTRGRILASAARLLGETGYHPMRMSDIALDAGTSTATLYQYFNNKTEITIEVTTLFLRFTEWKLLGEPLSQDAYADIFRTHLRYIQIYRDNSGLMGCLRTLADELEPVGHLTRDAYSEWRRRLARNLIKWSGAKPDQEKRVNLTAYALSLMTTELLYSLYVRQDPMLVELSGSPDDVARMLSAHWHRAALGHDLKAPEHPDRPRPARAAASNGSGRRTKVSPPQKKDRKQGESK